MSWTSTWTARFEAHIELLFKLLPGKVAAIEIKDIGPPIHEDRIPEFDPNDPESESGLWYKLVKGMADDFSFVNRLDKGWLIRMGKKVSMAEVLEADAMEANVGTDVSLSGHEVRKATPKDAAALIDLAYQTYRYSYDADFYDKKHLEEAIARNLYEITIL